MSPRVPPTPLQPPAQAEPGGIRLENSRWDVRVLKPPRLVCITAKETRRGGWVCAAPCGVRDDGWVLGTTELVGGTSAAVPAATRGSLAGTFHASRWGWGSGIAGRAGGRGVLPVLPARTRQRW